MFWNLLLKLAAFLPVVCQISTLINLVCTELENQGLLEPITKPTRWVSQLLLIFKGKRSSETAEKSNKALVLGETTTDLLRTVAEYQQINLLVQPQACTLHLLNNVLELPQDLNHFIVLFYTRFGHPIEVTERPPVVVANHAAKKLRRHN